MYFLFIDGETDSERLSDLPAQLGFRKVEAGFSRRASHPICFPPSHPTFQAWVGLRGQSIWSFGPR